MREGSEDERRQAVLFAMEQLLREHRDVAGEAARRRGLCGRHPGLRRSQPQGAQGRPLRLQPLHQEAAQGQSVRAPHHHPQGRRPGRAHRAHLLHVQRPGWSFFSFKVFTLQTTLFKVGNQVSRQGIYLMG